MLDVTDLETYMTKFGPLLGRQAMKAIRPLHIPGEHELFPIDSVRKPLDAQSHVITSLVKLLRRDKSALVVAEMGTGKSLISVATFHTLAAGMPYRAIVMCPPHLVVKWPREITRTAPGSTVVHLEHYEQLLGLPRKPSGAEWFVLSEVVAKLGPPWKPAVWWKLNGRVKMPHCAECGNTITRWDAKKGVDLPVSWEDLKKSRHECGICEAPVWQWTHELDKWPVSKFIRHKMKAGSTSSLEMNFINMRTMTVRVQVSSRSNSRVRKSCAFRNYDRWLQR